MYELSSLIISVFFSPSPPSATCILQCGDFIYLSRFEVSLDHQVAFGRKLERTTFHSSRTPRSFQRNIPYLRTKKSRSFITPLRSMQLFDTYCFINYPSQFFLHDLSLTTDLILRDNFLSKKNVGTKWVWFKSAMDLKSFAMNPVR